MENKTSEEDYTYSSVADVHCPAGDDCPWPVEVAKLESQLLSDPLTGLANYRHFSQALDQEMERTRRSGASTSLVMIDIDYFKKVNDSWGHEAGNIALQAMADCMRNCFRKLDVVCRYGGEEFAVILPATEALVAVQVAERLRKSIEAMVVDISDTQTTAMSINLTASLGVGIFTRHSKLNGKELVQQADEFLYQAKQQGRNQVCYAINKLESEAEVTVDEKDALNSIFGAADD